MAEIVSMPTHGEPNPTLIRVFEIAPPDGRFCHGNGLVQRFVEVDWFHDASQMPSEMVGDTNDISIATAEGRKNIEAMIRKKTYFRPDVSYLVLCPLFSFTINYEARRVYR